MSVEYDKLLGEPVLHEHGDKVDIDGDILTGDLEFPSTGFIMNDGSSRWRVTIDSSGAIVTTIIVAGGGTGSPMGLLLSLTYSS